MTPKGPTPAMKRLLTLALAATVLAWPAHTGASGHQLVVDGTAYDSTKEAGASIHWETYGDPQHAVFAERDQEWYPGDNGSEHIPCDYGIHWISNDNVLTISHCLEAPPSTTGPTTTSSTTVAPTSSPSTTLAVATTVPATTTSTSSPTTSTEPSTSSSTLPETTSSSSAPSSSQPAAPTTSNPTLSPTTTICTTGVVTDGVCQPVGAGETTTIAPKLPATGNSDDLAPWAVIAVCLGALCVLVARRRV